MRIGIDFGTSYSAAAVLVGERVKKIRFDDGYQFRSDVYFPDELPDMDVVSLEPEIEVSADKIYRQTKREADRGFARALARWEAAVTTKDPSARARAKDMQSEPTAPNDAALRSLARRVAQQQWMEKNARLPRSAPVNVDRAVYGDDAMYSYLHEGRGHIYQSMKSKLGIELPSATRSTVLRVVSKMFEHIRKTAEAQIGDRVHEAVIGRPVLFKSAADVAVSEQRAIALLTEAAQFAGFYSVSFLQEPLAASLAFHRETSQRCKTLVVDIGGGTTDLALVLLGGKRRPEVVDTWGVALGGADVDLGLAEKAFMPLFGMGRPRTYLQQYKEAFSVSNVQFQKTFLDHDYRHLESPFDHRMKALQRAGNTNKAAREVELSKIHLSDVEQYKAKLHFIEKGLVAKVDRDQLREGASYFWRKFDELLVSVASATAAPDVVFLTGGMSKSPYVREIVRKRFPKSLCRRGDASFGVVRGLAIEAASRAGTRSYGNTFA